MSFFVTFEGPEGSGKSTQVQLLAEFLRGLGHDVLLTREPGGTAIGDQIRGVLHDLRNKGMCPQTEALLFAASRAQIVREVIRPHLARGGLVLCDRYADSTLAYQGYGHGFDLAVLRAITAFAADGLWPDLTILLDLDVEEGLRRRRAANVEWNRLDDYELAFHRRVREGFLALAEAEPGRWVTLDARLGVAELQAKIQTEAQSRIGRRRKM